MIAIDITTLEGVDYLNLERDSISMEELRELESRLSGVGYIIVSISAYGGGMWDTLVIKISKKS